jgi:hypothetical protein
MRSGLWVPAIPHPHPFSRKGLFCAHRFATRLRMRVVGVESHKQSPVVRMRVVGVEPHKQSPVIPAQAGIHTAFAKFAGLWIPACAE